jgi:hypothetical protein
MPAFKSGFDRLDLEIIDTVYEAVWAHIQACQPNRNTALDALRQKTLRKKIFGIARMLGPGHVDFDTLSEVAIATIPERRTRRRPAA